MNNSIYYFLYSDINECSPNPCLNSGTCIDGVNSYTCKCLAGYVGKNCETGEYSCMFSLLLVKKFKTLIQYFCFL